MAISACSGELSPSSALGTIPLGTASRGARCQLHPLSYAPSPHGTRKGLEPHIFPLLAHRLLRNLSPRQDDGLLCAHHPSPVSLCMRPLYLQS